MRTLDFLCVAFTWAMHLRVEMAGVGAPIVGVVAGEPEGLQQRFELQKDLILAATKDVGQNLAGVVIDGMPEPAGVAFVADKRPHLIHLRFTSALQVPGHLGSVQCAQHSGVHRLQHCCFLLEFTQHSAGTHMQRSRCIAHPTGIETHIDDRLFDLRQAPAVTIVEQETALATEGVLTKVALGTPSCFAAFDDLLALTVRAADGDERHGPFLPEGGYEDEAQCDSNRSPSPLLKHYPQELLVTSDAGGSNGYRIRLWKVALQELADAIGLRISVCHFPPGTSKWNKIEHRMFCHITENWRGKPLVSRAVIVNLIGHTKTRTGLTINAELDENAYPTGIKVSDAELAAVRIKRAKFHGDWNYTISPRV